MNNLSAGSTRFQVSRRMVQSLTISALSTIGLLGGMVPGLVGSSHQIRFASPAAYAQGESVFTRYVRAAYEIETKLRLPMMTQVKQITGGNVPDNVCSPDGIQRVQAEVRGQVQGICRTFRAQAAEVVKRNSLTDQQFNEQQQQAQNPGFQKRIEEEVRRLNLQ